MAANAQVVPGSNKTSFRSRRSHQSLHNISLAPLTSTFPVDDYEDSNWSSRENDDQLPRTYLSTTSVPSTPPLISHSRSVSHTPKCKTPTRVPLSDTNLESISSLKPLHHTGKATRVPDAKAGRSIRRQDSEWLLRAGLALAASAREEKGQSWLVKRESSTSLVSDLGQEESGNIPRHRRNGGSRTSRSGISTPMGLSRRGSRSHLSSRRTSRGDLSMTIPESVGRHGRDMSSLSDKIGTIPDFVDENVRAEMEYFAQETGQRNGRSSVREGDHDSWNSHFETSSQVSSDSEFDSEDEVDELEMQRLTRERGFGMGRWVDRLVEWTLFSVDEEGQNYAHSASRTQLDSKPVSEDGRDVEDSPTKRTGAGNGEATDDDMSTVGDDTPPTTFEKPSPDGGWADIGWLLRAATKSAF